MTSYYSVTTLASLGRDTSSSAPEQGRDRLQCNSSKRALSAPLPHSAVSHASVAPHVGENLGQSFYSRAARRRNRDLRDELRALTSVSSVLHLVAERGEFWDAIGLSTALHTVASKSRDDRSYSSGSLLQNKGWRVMRRLLSEKLYEGGVRNLANNAWSLATMLCSDWPLCSDIARGIKGDAVALKTQEIANSCWAFATLKWRDEELLSCLAGEMLTKVETGGTQDFVNTLWAFSMIQFFDVPLFDSLAALPCNRAGDFKPQELANSAWSLATVALQNGPFIDCICWQVLPRHTEFLTQNLSNFIWAYAKLGYSSEAVISCIYKEADRKIEHFSVQDLVTSVWSLATMLQKDDCFLERSLPILQNKMIKQRLQPQHASNTLWALAVLAYADHAMLDFLCGRVVDQVGEFKGQESANSIWALATVPFQHKLLVERISGHVIKILSQISTQSLSNYIWAYAKLGYDQDEVIQGVKSEALRKLMRYSEQDLSTTIWAFSTMLHRDDKFVEAWMQAVRRKMMLQLLKPQHASNMLWALATVYFYDAEFFCDLTVAVTKQLASFGAQDLSCSVWACATVFHADESFTTELAREATRRMTQFDPQSVGNVAWALSHLDTKVKEIYDSIWRWVIEDGNIRCCNAKVIPMLVRAFFRGGRADLSWELFMHVSRSEIDPGNNALSVWLHQCRHVEPDVQREMNVLSVLAQWHTCQSFAATVLTAAALRLEEVGLPQQVCEVLSHMERHCVGNAVTQLLRVRVPSSCMMENQIRPSYPLNWKIPVAPVATLPCDYRKECQVLQHILATAQNGNPQSVLDSIESFSFDGNGWLKIAGDAKGTVLDDLIMRFAPPQPQLVLEFGCYVGYSATRMARLLSRWRGRLVSIEVDPVHACLARNVVEFAGLASSVSICIGYSEEVIPHLANMCGGVKADAVFMDQRGTRFHIDLQALVDRKLVSDGFAVAADNVLKPGAPHFLWCLQESLQYRMTVVSLREFASESVEDWIAVAQFQATVCDNANSLVEMEFPMSLSNIAFLTDRARKWSCAAESDYDMSQEAWAKHSQQMRSAYAEAGIHPHIVCVERRDDGTPFVNWHQSTIARK